MIRGKTNTETVTDNNKYRAPKPQVKTYLTERHRSSDSIKTQRNHVPSAAEAGSISERAPSYKTRGLGGCKGRRLAMSSIFSQKRQFKQCIVK